MSEKLTRSKYNDYMADKYQLYHQTQLTDNRVN